MIEYLGYRLLPVLVLAVMLATPVAAAVRADVDRTEVYVGDTVTLVIESNNPAVGEPDLSVLLQDFEILGTGSSSRFSMVNGRSTSLRSWRVQLRPRRMGELQIPMLRLDGEQTKALTISVSDIPVLANTSDDLPALVESSIGATGTVYVQQQIPVTVRLYQDQRVIDGTLEPLQVSDTLIESLGPERRYTVTRNGRQYRVSERRYAVAAERRGLLEIPALDFRGKLAPEPSGSGGVQPFRVSSEPLEIDVRPPAVDGDYWLPAQQVSVHDSWSDRAPTLRRGEPVDRVITLQATGLNGAQLPILQLETPSGARIYPGRQVNDTRADSSTLYGISRQTFTYVPGEDGRMQIPSFTVDWWNTATQQQESAEVAALTLQVMPGAVGRAESDPRATEEIAVDGSSSGEAGDALHWGLWLLLGIGLALAIFKWRHGLMGLRAAVSNRIPVPQRIDLRPEVGPPLPEESRSVAPDPSRRRPSSDTVGQHMNQLESACQRHDGPAAAVALLALGRLRWPDVPPLSLGDLAQRLQRGQREIEALDRVLYGSERRSWDGAPLWAAIAGVEWQAASAPAKEAKDGIVPPLYPQALGTDKS